MSTEAQFVLPVTLWNSSPPEHRISCVRLTPNNKKLVTSTFDGQLCIWSLNLVKLEIAPKFILAGHKNSVSCLVCTDDYAISSSEGGEIRRWNLEDGYCAKALKTAFIHKKMQLFKRSQSKDELLFTCGCYTEILVIQPFTLQTMYILYSKANSDWISCFQVLSSQEISSDVVSGLTGSGYLKLWIIDEINGELHYEVQSSLLPVKNATDIKCNLNQTELLIVALHKWEIFDAKCFKSICSEEAANKERLLGGDYYNNDVLVWTSTGKFYLYTIHNNLAKLNFVFHNKNTKATVYEPAMSFTDNFLIHGDFSGHVNIWKVELEMSEIEPILESRLNEKSTGKGGMFEEMIIYCNVTSCLYVSQLDKLIIGCSDGTILVMPAVQTIMSYYFHSTVAKPMHQTLLAHQGKVNCLSYPKGKYSHYSESLLVSGGSDFSVCLWDILKGQLLHKFCVHGGEVIRLIVPPETCRPRTKFSICSVSADHSVAVINLKERRCTILASRHSFPVVNIIWRPLDDFMLVECFDGTVYVWQLDTGHLDRVLDGVSAQEVLHEAQSDLQKFNFTYDEKNLLAEHSLERGLFQVNVNDLDSPLQLEGFLNVHGAESHVLMFSVKHLIAQMALLFRETPQSEIFDANFYQKVRLLTLPPNSEVKKTEQNKPDRQTVLSQPQESLLNMASFLVAVLHSWDLNPGLDKQLSDELGLGRPDLPVSFGLFSDSGAVSLSLENSGWDHGSNLVACGLVALNGLCDMLRLTNVSRESVTCRPSLEMLAKLWQIQSENVRQVVSKLLANELENLPPAEYSRVLDFWCTYLPHAISRDRFGGDNVDVKMTALVLFGVIGCEQKFKGTDSQSQESYVRQTCSSFWYLLSQPEDRQQPLSQLQCTAIEIIARGYAVWEPFFKMDKALLLLLELCRHDQDALEKCVAALQSIAIARTDSFLSCLIGEIGRVRSGQGGSTLDRSKTEIVLLLSHLLQTCPYIMLRHLSDAVQAFAFCIDSGHLKQDSLQDLVPSLSAFRQVHHCVSSQRVAVGQQCGAVVVHDFKTGRSQAIAAHADAVTAVAFSPDGKSLASYCCFENRLCFWQVASGIFGLGQVHVKCVKSCRTQPLHDEEIRNHMDIGLLSWRDNKSVALGLCDGSEASFYL